MISKDFPDNSPFLFGREADLAHLAERISQRGITAVVGRPQMGKSWVLLELARRLSGKNCGREKEAVARVSSWKRLGELLGLSPPPQADATRADVAEGPRYLVGYYESMGETPDLILRAVSDLYTRWLTTSSYMDQARIVYHQQKHDTVGRTGEAVGLLLEKFSKLGGKATEAVGAIVKSTFEGLALANRDLVSGGIQVSRLQIDQVKELIQLLHDITQATTILIFDQWEKSPNLMLKRA